jgi:hypothetical protein
VVSVSIGSSKRDSREQVDFLGQSFILERLGTDGDMKKAAEMYQFLDGKVDALGVGGADLEVTAADKSYKFREIAQMVAGVKTTPVVDGGGLKHTLERLAVRQLDSHIHWKGTPTLMVSAVDRFGMAEALAELGAEMVYGDIVFGIGINYPIRSIEQLRRLAKVILPIITKLPFKWFYPTGEKQETSVQGVGTQYFSWAKVLAGDFHYIKRYAPENLSGKIILTNTTTASDVEWARDKGVAQMITTTPRINGRSFGNNVMEAMIVALAQKGRPLTEAEYLEYIGQLEFKPTILEL